MTPVLHVGLKVTGSVRILRMDFAIASESVQVPDLHLLNDRRQHVTIDAGG